MTNLVFWRKIIVYIYLIDNLAQYLQIIFPLKRQLLLVGKIMKKKYYVYILSSKRNGTIYTGFTNTLKRRVYEHKIGLIAGFTKKYNVKNLVYFEIHDCVATAIFREKKIKKWQRAWKVRLIESMNPEWNDLYDEILNLG